MKAKTIAFVILAGLLTLFTTPVYAQEDIPPLPHAFYGTVEVNGSPAPAGTEVEARGEGVQTGVESNPVVITVEGRYGSSEPLEPKLIVQGDIAEGSAVTFYVSGVSTGQTAEWHSGGVTELNLAVTIEGPPPETTETPPPETTETPPPETTETPPPETTETPPPETTETPPPETPSAPPAPPAPPASPSPTAPAKAINWPVLWGVIGGMTAVGITAFVLARKRAKRKVY